MAERLSKIEQYGVPPSVHGRKCVICGEPFGKQCFGLCVATDISVSLEDARHNREVCDRCAQRYASAHFSEGSMARILLSLRGWWWAFRWYWPRRHQFDELKHRAFAPEVKD